MRKRSVQLPDIVFVNLTSINKKIGTLTYINHAKMEENVSHIDCIDIPVSNVKQKLLHMSLCQARSMNYALFPLHYEF